MSPPVITYRGPGAWGAGYGSDLSALQFDTNNWNIYNAFVELFASSLSKQIAYIAESNGELFVNYTDHSIDGPFPIPTAAFVWRGTWLPNTIYNVNDTFSFGATVYAVLFGHTSAATFDPGANDGMGHNFYAAMLSVGARPSLVVTTSTFTPTITYANSYIRFTNPGGCTITLQSVSLQGWVLDTEMTFRDESLVSGGGLFVGASSPAVLHYGQFTHAAQSAYSGGSLFVKMYDTNQWDLGGALLAL